MNDLDTTCLTASARAFSRSITVSTRVPALQPILRNLKERALHAFNEYRNRHMSPSLDIQLHIGPEDQFTDELAIFGGQTRVMTNKFLSRRRHKHLAKPRSASAGEPCTPTSTATPAPMSTSSTPAPGTSTGAAAVSSPQTASTPSDDGIPLPHTVEEQMEGVHPALMEYLSLFPTAASISVINQQGPWRPQVDVDTPMGNTGAASAQDALFAAAAAQQAASPTAATSPFAPPLAAALSGNGAGAGTAPQPQADPLAFLNVLPEGHTDALFFGGAGPAGAVSTGIFDGSFVAGELGEQWTSLMRETGFFPIGDAQGSVFRNDPPPGHAHGTGGGSNGGGGGGGGQGSGQGQGPSVGMFSLPMF